jgi:hypothetical protein
VDLGHAALAFATIPVALSLVHAGLPRATVLITRFGVAVMAITGALHLLLALHLVDRTAMLTPLLVGWGLFGVWLVAERALAPSVAVLAAVLGFTVIAWSLLFGAHPSNDAVRVAGGGIFMLGYPIWLAYAAWRPAAPAPRGPARSPLARAFNLGVTALATLVLGLPAMLIWIGATIGGPVLGDPGYPLTVTNATDAVIVVGDANAGGGRSRIGPGETQEILWSFGSLRDGTFTAATIDGTPLYCRDLSAREYLRIRTRLTVTRDEGSC